MEGISKQYLKNSHVSIEDAPIDDAIKSAFAILVEKLIDECRELQEPWMTLDEFLKSGFQGWCWLCFKEGTVLIAYRNFDDFYADDDRVEVFRSKNIAQVMPIHKPEPPR